MFFTVSGFCDAPKVFFSDGPADKKRVAFTFDDGPGKATEDILEILKEKNAKATFFMLGTQVKKYPELAEKVKLEGHEVANHTYGHVNFFAYNEEDKESKIEEELLKGGSIIEKTTGVKPYLVRFPHGYFKKDAKEISRKNNYYVINWTFGCDWDKKMIVEEMHAKYLHAAKSGCIYLMHDGWSNEKLIFFLGSLIDEIRAKGYEIVTVGELLGVEAKISKNNNGGK